MFHCGHLSHRLSETDIETICKLLLPMLILMEDFVYYVYKVIAMADYV